MGAITTDPVCGMQVDERTPAEKTEYRGRLYYFCNKECKLQFDRNPEKYTATKVRTAGGGC